MMRTDEAAHSSHFDLSGKVALVTGSSQGIGKALAKGLREAGARLVLNARHADRLEDSRAALAATPGPDVYARVFDVTDEDQVKAAIGSIELEVGPINVLINNAGMQHRAPLVEFDLEHWNKVLATNLTSAFLVGRTVARSMISRGTGKIINIGSVQTALARPTIAPYASSKGGLKMLTQSMCCEWARHGIQANAIAPGYFETDLTRALVEDGDFSAWLRQRTPAARWGQTHELIGAAVFLASPAADFVNGQTIYVDGGMTAVV